MTPYERDFERISKVVQKEAIRFEKEKSKGFKNHMIKYLRHSCTHSSRYKYWGAFLPEAKATS